MQKQKTRKNKNNQNKLKEDQIIFQNSDCEQSDTEAGSLSEVTINKELLKEIADILSTIISENKKPKDYKNEITPFMHEHVPKISLFDYLLRIQKYSEIEYSTIIISLIYLDRICCKKGIKLSKYNIHRLLFTSILTAIKYNEDIIYDTKFYSKVAGVSIDELKILENSFLKIIDFQLFVSDELYKKYYNYLFHEDEFIENG